jgi:hypothetical protein
MSDLVAQEDVVKGTVFGPHGPFDVYSCSVRRKMGLGPDSITVKVLANSRLADVKPFPGSFEPGGASSFTKGLLPAPAGTKFEALIWDLRILPPEQEPVRFENLLLTEVSVEDYSRAESPVGPATTDRGQDRKEILNLTFIDARAFWNETGSISGERNKIDRSSPYRKEIVVRDRTLRINAPKLEYSPSGEGDAEATVRFGTPTEVSIELLGFTDTFDPGTVKPNVTLWSAEDLLLDIAARLPLIKDVGPSETLAQLGKLFPLNLDFGHGATASQAFRKLEEEFGLIIGLQPDSSIVVEFESIPSAKLLEDANLIANQTHWNDARRSGRIIPRTPGYRFFPEKVIKEILLTDFEPVVKNADGRFEPFADFLARNNISPETATGLAYDMMTKLEVEHVGRATRGEALMGGGPGLGTAAPSKTREDAVRVLSDYGFRAFRYAPSERILQAVSDVARKEREKASRSFKETTIADSDDFGKGGRNPQTETGQLRPFNTLAMIDRLLAPPFNIVTKIQSLNLDLRPRFFADLPLRRMYECFRILKAIPLIAFLRVTKLGQIAFSDKLIPAFVAEINALVKQHKVLSPMNRRPPDWSEAKGKAESFQSEWISKNGGLDGTMDVNSLIGFWFQERSVEFGQDITDPEDEIIVEYIQFVEGIHAPHPLEVLATHVSADATDFAKDFDEKNGIVVFDRPVGLFSGSTSTRKMLEQSKEFLDLVSTGKLGQAVFLNVDVNSTFVKQTAGLMAAKIQLILDEDRKNVQRLGEILAVSPDLVFFGIDPTDFRKILETYLKRSPTFPLWQLSSLGIAREVAEKEAKIKGTPKGVVAPVRSSLESQLPVVQKPVRAANGGTTVIKVPSQAPPSQTVPAPVSVSAKGPVLTLTPVLARAFVEAPFDETAWPSVDFGQPPFKAIKLDEVWVEDLFGNVSNLARFQELARIRFREETSGSTTELSEEIKVNGVFPSKIGAAVREVAITFGMGGRDPEVNASGSYLGSRELPVQRAINALARLIAVRSNTGS